MERQRLNAINAKRNRDRKKKEKEALVAQMDILRQDNQELEKELQKAKAILQANGLLHLMEERVVADTWNGIE